MSSSSYKKFAHIQIQLQEIASATNHFSDANLIKRSASGKAYKGQLLWSGHLIDVVAERFNSDFFGPGDVAFWKEISMLSSLKHDNLVSLVGFCDEQEEKIIITKLESNGSLYKYLGDPTLTWMQRLNICVHVAHALSYIYYHKERDFSVIHRNIKSSKILLNDHWKPKLCGFRLSFSQKASQRNRLCITDVCGTEGYADPQYLQSGRVSHKSDMYSFGVILFEVLCGKKAVMVDEKNKFLAPLAKFHYEGGTIDDLIDPGLRIQMGPKSFKIFSETAYCCLKEERSQCPNIDQIVIKLEEALETQWRHENPADSMTEGTTSKSLKGKNLKHLEISLLDIETATENFDDRYCIGLGSYGKVYKAELDYFDSVCRPLEEKNIGELPKKRSTVAIKRILFREDQQGEQGFLAEIELLTSCKHPNIVSLLGFCEERRHMILVYEYVCKGSLDDYLGTSGNLTNLTWLQRIKICIGAACGLNYLHTQIQDDRTIIHRDIKSGNILLGENWEAKIADFGLSRLIENQVNSLYTKTLAGTEVYLDPEYEKTGKLNDKIDIYSFGVVLFEMLSGRLANDPIFIKENSYGIAPVGRQRFKEGRMKEMIDPRLMEETHENIFTLNIGPDQDSLDAFSQIAYQCVAETQAERPSTQVIIKKLEEALSFQENPKHKLKISLAEIQLATQMFNDKNLIGRGRFGNIYKGDAMHANGCNTVAVERFDRSRGVGDVNKIFQVLRILLEYKHENIIGLVGYCNEMGENIIVYEYATRRSLDMHLKDYGLTWMKRLEICIDIASGLDFLHGGSVTQVVVIHRDIKSSKILLNDDWKAKITDLGSSLITPINKDMDVFFDSAPGTVGYDDPQYVTMNYFTERSDIYSFGVILCEILCGRPVIEFSKGVASKPLTRVFKCHHEEGTLDEIIFDGIKEQIVPKSLSTFQRIAYRCLHQERDERPTTREVLLELKKALKLQMEHTSGNTFGTAYNRVTAPTTNELVLPLAQNVLVGPHNDAEKFDGLNFKRWLHEMHFYLTTHNLAGFLTEDAPELNAEAGNIQAPSVVDAWKHSDYVCRNIVLNNLVDELYDMHSDAKTAKELWESLDRKYNTERQSADVVARFLEYKMVDSKKVVDQVQELQIMMNDIRGTSLSETFQVVAIIEKLPSAWVDFKNNMKLKRMEMSVEDLVMLLRTEEFFRCG